MELISLLETARCLHPDLAMTGLAQVDSTALTLYPGLPPCRPVTTPAMEPGTQGAKAQALKDPRFKC